MTGRLGAMMGLVGLMVLAGVFLPAASAHASTTPADLFLSSGAAVRWHVSLSDLERRSGPAEAEAEVRVKARHQFALRIKEQFPHSTWTPSQEFVDRHLIRHVTVLLRPGEGGMTLYSAEARLELTRETRKEVLRLLREEVARGRQRLAVKFILFAVGLCVATAAYSYLRRHTSGTSVYWLRAAAVAVLLFGLVGLWWWVQ